MTTFLDRISSMSPKRLALLALELQNRLDEIEHQKHEPIAIIGMSCRFPGGDTPEEFWNLLENGGDAITEVPRDRWDVDRYYDADSNAPGKTTTRSGGFVQNVEQFDPHFFGIAPREAIGMDPQQRFLLEVAWEALENAGQAPADLMGSKTGVFVGMCGGDYFHMQLQNGLEAIDAYLASGTAHSIASGRLSYILGLQGPSLSVDTACSSSLVAIHLAVQSLRKGECNMALAGGANLLLSPETTIALSRAKMMSPDGRCKTFDSRADGFVRSEGCGVLILKRLSDAVADGDNILALIRGSAMNQDGRSNGLTAPNGPSQESVIREALVDAGVTPDQISYVEAHGTGTSLGDPIEVQALAAVLGTGHSHDNPIMLGSVKTNIGHAEGAAGVAGVIKVIMALQHQQIPPHLHLQIPNPYIPWERLPVEVPTALTPWNPEGQRLAGVSSFGFSGTNVHIVLEEAPIFVPAQDKTLERPLHLLTLSAKDENAFREQVQHYIEAIGNFDSAANVAFSANTGRSHFNHRLAITGSTVAELQTRLQAFANNENTTGAVYSHFTSTRTPQTAFLFTGQGSQYSGMGKQLYETQPTFHAALDKCDTILQAHLDGASIKDIIFSGDGRINATQYTQPALFALEYSLAEMWQSWGIVPTAVMGHSVGEYVAACVAGVFSLEDGLKLITARGRLMGNLPLNGAMAAIFADLDTVKAAIEPYAQTVSLAAINGPSNIVISGLESDVMAILNAGSFKSRRLNVSHAFHSPLMNPILDAFTQVAEQVTYNAPRIAVITNVSGQEINNSAYWRNHISRPVEFSAAINTLCERGIATFVEIGPSPVLVGMAQYCVPENYGVWLPSLREKQDDWKTLLNSLSELYVHGVPVDWKGFDKDYAQQHVLLPTYPFQRQRYWINSRAPEYANASAAKSAVSSADELFHNILWEDLSHGFTASDLAVTSEQLMIRVPEISAECGIEPYNQLQPRLNELCTAYIVRGFQKLGHTFQVGQTLTVPDLLARYRILPAHTRLMERMLDILVEDDWLTRNGDICTVAQIPQTVDPDALWSTLMEQFPTFDAELNLTGRCASSLVEVLHGEVDPLNLLFPGGSFADTEKLYQYSPASQTYNTMVQEAVASLRERNPEGRTLRILEIGAGTGGTTSYVLPMLDPISTEYVFTDVSALFAQKAKTKFGQYSFVEYSALNIEANPIEQGFQAHSYDLIIAANVIHATADLQVTLSNVQSLLHEDGVFILLEATAPSRFGDLTVGLTDGWWGFTDTDLRPNYALLNTNQWLNLLGELEFSDARALPGMDAPGVLAQQAVFISRNTKHIAPQSNANWLILDDGQLGQQLAAELTAQGDSCVVVAPQRAIPVNETGYQGLIDLRPTQAVLDDSLTVDKLNRLQHQITGGILDVIQTLVRQSGSQPARLYLVTRGGQAVEKASENTPDVNAVQASVWGLSHVIEMEHPELTCTRIDLDASASDADNIASLVAELHFDDHAETQIAYRDNTRLGRRLAKMPLATFQPINFKSDASYLITGGLTGLGLLVAEWMTERGAGHIALMGRRTPSTEANITLQRLAQAGVDIKVVQGDVSIADDVARAIQSVQSEATPLRGVMHAAGALDDGTLMMQNWSRFETVMKAKVAGTWHLHQLTHDLDFMVLFSTGASLLGSAGQGNHAAANAFMDGLAYYRQVRGLPTVSLNWGAWSGVGAAVDRNLDTRLDTISPTDGLLALERAMRQGIEGGHPQIALLPINWQRVAVESLDYMSKPLLSMILRDLPAEIVSTAPKAQETQKEAAHSFMDELAATIPNKRIQLIRTKVRSHAAHVLGIDPDYPIKMQQPLSEIGLDSLMAVELRNVLGNMLGKPLPATIIFDYPTIDALTDYLKTTIPLDMSASVDTNEPEPEADEFDMFSDDELASLLASKLDDISDDQ